jgi:hypothetical protein
MFRACSVRLDGLEKEIPTVRVDPLPPDLEKIADVSWGLAERGWRLGWAAFLTALDSSLGGLASHDPAALC